jgi:hypothetical protein
MSYFPLDRDLLTSSTWARGTPEQIKVWLYLLLAADPRTGRVEDTPPAIALRCGLPLDVTEAALEWLAAPDPHSRTKTDKGRRIRVGPAGIEVVNYLRRRDKDYSTPRWRRWKERQRANGVGKRSEAVGNDEHEHEHGNKEKKRELAGLPAADAAVSPASTPAPDGLLDHDPHNQLEAAVARLVRDFAEEHGRDQQEMLATLSLTGSGLSLDRIRNAPPKWLTATLAVGPRFAEENRES